MSDKRALIFDYYGTLAEFTPAQRVAVFDDLARQVGAALAPGEAYRHWRERTTRDTALRLRGHDRPPAGRVRGLGLDDPGRRYQSMRTQVSSPRTQARWPGWMNR